MPAVRQGVFVSYARADGAGVARRLVHELGAAGIDAWLDRHDLYGGLAWRRQIVDAMGDCAYLVLVLTPAALASDVVAWEWQTARRLGLCVLPVRAHSVLDAALAPRWMADLHWYTLDEEWDTFVEDLRGPCEADRVPFMAADLPARYVTRYQELSTARRLLVGGSDGSVGPVPNLVLHGPGGYGKTTLAQALCHDDEVTAVFHDGVLWVSLGQQPDVFAELERIHRALTGAASGAVDAGQAAEAVRDRLRDRRCLLVVDDVWTQSDVRPFMHRASHSVRIVTTRRFDVANELPAGRLRIDTMTSAEAVELVTKDLPSAPADDGPYRQLVERLGAWPLLVNLASGALRTRIARGAPAETALTAVREALDRQNMTAFDTADPDERNQAAAASVAVSLEMMAAEDVSAWAELAVFPEDTPIPLGTLGQLWGSDRFEAEERALRLADASLLHLDLGQATIEVHDVLLASAQQRVGDLRPLHGRLLDAWGDPRTLPTADGYAWRWIVHHLVGAGRTDAMAELLLDPQWLEHRLAAVAVKALLGDFTHVPDHEPHRSVRETVRMSRRALAADPRQLTGQLRGRLLSARVRGLAPVLDLAGRLPGPRLVPVRASLRVPPDVLFDDPAPDTARHDAPVVGLAAADGGRVAVSASGDGVLKVWDVATGALLRTIDDDRVDADPRPSPWDPPRPPTWGRRRGPLLAGFAGGRQAVTFADGRLTVWDLDAGTRLRDLADAGPTYGSEYGATPEGGLTVTPDGRYVVLARDSLVAWDQETGHVRTVAANRATTVALCGDRRVVTGSSHLNPAYGEAVPANALRVFDVETGNLIHMLLGHPCGVNALAVTGDGRLVASAPNPGLYMYSDPCPRVWDVDAGEQVRELNGHGHTVTAVAISPDGRHVVTGGGCCFERYGPDFTVRVWNAETGELRDMIVAHTGPVAALLATPDNRWAVSAGGVCPQGLGTGPEHGGSYTTHDGSIRLHDLETATLAATFQADDAVAVMALAGPHTIFGGGLDGAVHILRIDVAVGPHSAS